MTSWRQTKWKPQSLIGTPRYGDLDMVKCGRIGGLVFCYYCRCRCLVVVVVVVVVVIVIGTPRWGDLVMVKCGVVVVVLFSNSQTWS